MLSWQTSQGMLSRGMKTQHAARGQEGTFILHPGGRLGGFQFRRQGFGLERSLHKSPPSCGRNSFVNVSHAGSESHMRSSSFESELESGEYKLCADGSQIGFQSKVATWESQLKVCARVLAAGTMHHNRINSVQSCMPPTSAYCCFTTEKSNSARVPEDSTG